MHNFKLVYCGGEETFPLNNSDDQGVLNYSDFTTEVEQRVFSFLLISPVFCERINTFASFHQQLYVYGDQR